MSHTPGPWRVQLDDDHGGTFDIGVKKGGVWWPLPLSNDNARLLEAAPDMLAALKICVGHDEARFMPGYASAKAAIAKAEGR